MFEDPNLPMGVRDYRPEDDFRRIHWPATARTGMLAGESIPTGFCQSDRVCLNVSTLTHYWEGTYPELLEHLVSVTAGLVQHSRGRWLPGGFDFKRLPGACRPILSGPAGQFPGAPGASAFGFGRGHTIYFRSI